MRSKNKRTSALLESNEFQLIINHEHKNHHKHKNKRTSFQTHINQCSKTTKTKRFANSLHKFEAANSTEQEIKFTSQRLRKRMC